MIENFSDKYPKNQFIQLNKNDVDYFASNLYDLIQNAYSNIGGHIEFSNVDSFKNTDLNFWIASDIDDDPNADVVIGGKHTNKGIKITLGGQDGSRLSIATMISKIKDLMKQKGFYTEMDEELARKVKLQPIEDFDVISKVLENKKLINLGNGVYERKIGGQWKRKVLVGIPRSSYSDIRFEEGGTISKYKSYEIEIEERPLYKQVHATIKQNGNEIGSIHLDNFPNEPYVAYSGIDEEHSGKGLGSYVYQLLDDYSFNKTGKHITHGDINSSISAIRLWRKRLKDTNYLPDGFYDYWGDDSDEVLKELNNPDIRFAEGGELKSNSFMKWFVQWYKPISNKVNIAFSFSNHLQPFKEKNAVILDVFEKIDQSVDAKPCLQEIIQKADEYGVVIYLEPKPRHKNFQHNLEKKNKISKDYLIGYYEKLGFELTQNKLFMKREPNTLDIRFAEGGEVNTSFVHWTNRNGLQGIFESGLLLEESSITNNLELPFDSDNNMPYGIILKPSISKYSKRIGSIEGVTELESLYEWRMIEDINIKDFFDGFVVRNNTNKERLEKHLDNNHSYWNDFLNYYKNNGYNISIVKNTKYAQGGEFKQVKDFTQLPNYQNIYKGAEYYSMSDNIEKQKKSDEWFDLFLTNQKERELTKEEFSKFMILSNELAWQDFEQGGITKNKTMNKEFIAMHDGQLPSMYKKGGSIKHGGITYGPSHDDGGIKVLNKATNTMLEVEGGELVLNKKVAALDTKVNLNGKEMTPCEAASELNQMAGNGVAFNCKDVANKQFLEDGGELAKGIEVEKEHMETLDKLYNQDITPSQAIQEVALEHILENPNYYDDLKMIEHENNHKKGCSCCNHSSLEVELKMPRFDNGGTIDFGDVNLPGVQGVDKKKSITDIIEEKEFQENRYTQRQLKNKELYAEAINMLQKLLQVDYKKILLEGDATKYLGRYLDKFKHLNLYKLGWRGTIGVSKEWAGICSVDSAKIESEKAKKTKREISISYNFVVGDDNFGTFMEDTILHEIAHAIVFEVFYLNDFEIPYDQLKFYKPEDVFRFDHPHQMIDPQHFETQGHGVTWANICNTLTGGYICDIFYRMMIKNEQMSNYMYKCINCNHEGFGDNSRFANKCANCGTPVLIQKNK